MILAFYAQCDSYYHMRVAISEEGGTGGGLRERKRIQLMRQVQSVALDLFEKRGFDGVTIDEIATAAQVSAPTIYRNFETKEGLILWDEYDQKIFLAIVERLPSTTPTDAIREALISVLETVYLQDDQRILRRATLVTRTDALRRARASETSTFRRELAGVLLKTGSSADAMEADVIAAATGALLEVAVEHWVGSRGKHPLAFFLRDAFEHLGRLQQAPGVTTTGRKAPVGKGTRKTVAARARR